MAPLKLRKSNSTTDDAMGMWGPITFVGGFFF